MLIAQHSIPDVFKVQDVLLKGRRKGGGEQVMRGQGCMDKDTWLILHGVSWPQGTHGCFSMPLTFHLSLSTQTGGDERLAKYHSWTWIWTLEF